MMKAQEIHKTKTDPFLSGMHFVRNFSMGMIIGIIIMLIVGNYIQNIGLGIATGPALGAGIGFGLHGILNRNQKENLSQPQLKSKRKVLTTLLISGLLLCVLILVYLIN